MDGEGAAKPLIITGKHMAATVSRATARSFIDRTLTPVPVYATAYELKPLQPRPHSDTSYKDNA